MTIAFLLEGRNSLNSEFFGDAPEGVLCPNCRTCLDKTYVPKNLKIHPARRYDIAYTHDLVMLFSRRFIDICRTTSRFDEEIHDVTGKGNYFYFLPHRVVEFDAERRSTRFLGKCSLCGHFAEVIGATPAVLKCADLPDGGFFRTDLAFASYQSKHPLIVISMGVKKVLETHKLRGLRFEEVKGSSDA